VLTPYNQGVSPILSLVYYIDTPKTTTSKHKDVNLNQPYLQPTTTQQHQDFP
jgi:hypothetical protein